MDIATRIDLLLEQGFGPSPEAIAAITGNEVADVAAYMATRATPPNPLAGGGGGGVSTHIFQLFHSSEGVITNGVLPDASRASQDYWSPPQTTLQTDPLVVVPAGSLVMGFMGVTFDVANSADVAVDVFPLTVDPSKQIKNPTAYGDPGSTGVGAAAVGITNSIDPSIQWFAAADANLWLVANSSDNTGAYVPGNKVKDLTIALYVLSAASLSFEP